MARGAAESDHSARLPAAHRPAVYFRPNADNISAPPMTSAESASRERPCVGVIMGSTSDLQHMQGAIDLLAELGVPYEAKIVSAHRTPDWMFEYASTAESRGIEVIVAAAGGAAHLPGMVAAKCVLPVLGVPIPATMLNGLDSLLSIVQMPKGVPVGTLAIGAPGALNAALLATSIVSTSRPALRERLRAWRATRTEDVMANTDIPPKSS
jgi:5-(carboxyamino)imidazole ribonucleotide mutase